MFDHEEVLCYILAELFDHCPARLRVDIHALEYVTSDSRRMSKCLYALWEIISFKYQLYLERSTTNTAITKIRAPHLSKIHASFCELNVSSVWSNVLFGSGLDSTRQLNRSVDYSENDVGKLGDI